MKEKRCDWKKLLCMVLVAVFVVQLVPSSVLAEMVESVQAPEKTEGTVIATETDEPATIQGDVVKLIKADGTVAASYTYDPWGKILTSTGDLANINPLRYRGYYYDTETGLYYLQSRYYDPEIGRFINADSYASTDATGLLSTNMFAYCENDPVNGSDPNGEWIHIAIGSAMGAVTSIITGYASAKQAGKDYSLFMAVTDGLSGAASGALAASGVGMVGQIIGNAAIEVTKGIVNGQSSANEIIENAISGGANGLIGGKGASYSNANSITKSGKQMLKRIFKYKDPVKKAYAHYKKLLTVKGENLFYQSYQNLLRKRLPSVSLRGAHDERSVF